MVDFAVFCSKDDSEETIIIMQDSLGKNRALARRIEDGKQR